MTLPEILSQVMHSDRHRLRSQWQRSSQAWPMDTNDPSYQRWLQSAQQSANQFSKRQRSVPKLQFDDQLPITAHRQQLVELLNSRQTIVVCGETGSGKSTQLPKICLQAGLGRAGMIGHTQPRRLAARAVASRLAEELGSQIGDLVGYKIRFADSTGASTLVKVMTDGVLLAETQSDRFLEQYDVIIIDEAHERSLNIDFLLGYLRRLQSRRPELKLVITSATIDPQRFSDHFADALGPAPIVHVSGRTYPVEIRYSPPKELSTNDDQNDLAWQKSIAAAADQLLVQTQGDILVFLPTERDIRENSKYLRGHFAAHRLGDSVEILPLYARLSQAEQNRIFTTHSGRRIVLATNVAESSLTVPGIGSVIDTGLVRLSRYASRSKVQRLPIEPISQASANQRSGRCGRLGPGVCIRLFEESDFQGRPLFTTPEIRRSDLANVLLQSYVLKLGPLDQFPLLDTPNPEAIRDAQRTLRELGVLDDHQLLTTLGQQLGRLPCDVRVGRMLIEAHQRQCLNEVIIIAAGLESNEVRQRPAGLRDQADSAHQQFLDPHSDFLSLIRLWDFYEDLHQKLSRSRLQKALQQNFLSHHGFREWSDIVRQLRDLLAAAGLKPGRRQLQLSPVPINATQTHSNRGQPRQPSEQPAQSIPRPEGYAAIHQSLLAGLLSGIAERGQGHQYKAAGGLAVQMWPGSGLFRRSPKWIVAAETVETSQRFVRTVAELDVQWIEHAGQELLKHSYSQPHWSEKSGAALIYEKCTLFGLTIVAGRRVRLAPIDPELARQMLIEHGLVAGQWNCDLPFYRHNHEIIKDIEELVKRTRQRQFIVDHYHLMEFYGNRLPTEISDLSSLRNWSMTHAGSQQEQSLWLKAEDLLSSNDQSHLDVSQNFPNTLRIGATDYPLTYHFEPGHDQDGVTITVPQAALGQVGDGQLDWLVPGLLEQKIVAMIKALPKSLRTALVPAPDVAQKLAQRLKAAAPSTSFLVTLAREMSQLSGESISAGLLSSLKVQDHLRFCIQVIDDHGSHLASGRDLHSLIQQFGTQRLPDSAATDTNPSKENPQSIARPEDIDQVPVEMTINRGGIPVTAYRALVDAGGQVQVHWADTPVQADQWSRTGVTRLFAIQHSRSLRSQLKNLPHRGQSMMSLGPVMPTTEWQEQLELLLARIAFVEDQALPRSWIDFQARGAQATALISMATQDVAAWLNQLATEYQQLRLCMEKATKLWSAATGQVQQQLDELFAEGFLPQTPWKWLAEYPRYIKAARMRLEKLVGGGLPKDQQIAAPLVAAWTAYQQVLKSPQATLPDQAESLQMVRWAIEELRVSLFAQQLGTKITVSAKRVDEMLAKLR